MSEKNNIIIFIIVITILLLSLAVFIVSMLFFYQKRQLTYRQTVRDLKLNHEKTLLKTQLEIQEQTLQNVSREIHDNINLSLTLAKLNLNTISAADPVKTDEKISAAVTMVSKAISDLSHISHCLNSEIISEQGLIKALELEIQKLNALETYIVRFGISGQPVFINGQKELIIFRIIQESLNNILKHAQAKKIDLSLNYTDQDINIQITDDGIGFISNEMNHKNCTAGLKNMRKRAELINGKFDLQSNPNNGTSINITIPFD